MFSRANAILNELRLDVRLSSAGRREREALIQLGEAAASVDPADQLDLTELLIQVRLECSKVEGLRSTVADSLAADRADFGRVSRWMRPVVVVRGLCTRAVLRHRIRLGQRALADPRKAIGIAVANRATAFERHPELIKTVADARAELRALLDERSHALARYGGSALPRWFPEVGRESTVLGRALWLQLRPTVLPRGSALAGLAVGWWLADTYTDSHLRSVWNSLGLGHGGKRVVSGEIYRAMMFWLPLIAAALFAYLADRAQLLIQRRYSNPTPPP